MFILFLYLKVISGNKPFCDQKKFDSIHINKIIEERELIYSVVDIRIGGDYYQWNLKTNKPPQLIKKKKEESDIIARLFIPTLPNCTEAVRSDHSIDESSDNSTIKSIVENDCKQLSNLSKTAIIFSNNFNEYSYEMTPGEDLPWNMSAKGDALKDPIEKYKLWPKGWVNSEHTGGRIRSGLQSFGFCNK